MAQFIEWHNLFIVSYHKFVKCILNKKEKQHLSIALLPTADTSPDDSYHNLGGHGTGIPHFCSAELSFSQRLFPQKETAEEKIL